MNEGYQQKDLDKQDTPARMRDVPGEMEMLSKQISQLESVWDAMRERLEQLVRSEPPSTGNKIAVAVAEESIAGLASAIRAEGRRMREIRESIGDYLRRLEL